MSFNPLTWFGGRWSGLGFFNKDYGDKDSFDSSHFEEWKGSNVKQMRANAIYLNANDDFVSAIRQAEERGVIGSGLNIQWQTEDIEFNVQVEKWLKVFKKKKNYLLNSSMHFNLACRTMVGTRKIQGGMLIRHHFNKKWTIPYKVEHISLDEIDDSMHDFQKGLFNGIQINESAQITGIYLYSDKDRMKSTLVNYNQLDLYVVPFIDLTQYQGVPEIAPVLASLKLLREYSYAELKRAKRDSQNSIIVQSQHYAEVISAKIKAALGKKDLIGATKALEESRVKGTIDGAKYVPSTDKVELLNKDYKSIYQSLQSNVQTMASAGVGMSPQTVLKNVKDVNYTSALFNSQNDNDYFEIQLDNLEGLALDEILGNFLDALVMSGKVKAPNYFIDPEPYRIFEIMRKSTVHNDIAKTAKATDTSLNNGSLSMIDHLASRNIDSETHIRKQIKYKQEEERIAKEMGYTPKEEVAE